jgi:hypothetical protein
MLLSFRFRNDHLLSPLKKQNVPVSGFDIQFLHHFALGAKTTCTASFVMIISVSVYAVSVCLTLYAAGFILFSWVLMTWINQHT